MFSPESKTQPRPLRAVLAKRTAHVTVNRMRLEIVGCRVQCNPHPIRIPFVQSISVLRSRALGVLNNCFESVLFDILLSAYSKSVFS
jgi:hypothetical protein